MGPNAVGKELNGNPKVGIEWPNRNGTAAPCLPNRHHFTRPIKALFVRLSEMAELFNMGGGYRSRPADSGS